jgi:hypothetical protein
LDNNEEFLLKILCDESDVKKILYKISIFNQEDKDTLFKYVMKIMYKLIINKKGSIFMQVYLTTLNYDQLDIVLKMFENQSSILNFCCNDLYANWTIQSFISTIKSPDYTIFQERLLHSLQPLLNSISYNKIGVYVLISIFDNLKYETYKNIPYFTTNYINLITNSNGLILIKKFISKILENNDLANKKLVFIRTCDNFHKIIKNKYGYYGLNYIIDSFSLEYCKEFCNLLSRDIDTYAIKSYSFKIVKKILRNTNIVSINI